MPKSHEQGKPSSLMATGTAAFLLGCAIFAGSYVDKEPKQDTFHYGSSIEYNGGSSFTVYPYEEVDYKDENGVDRRAIMDHYIVEWGDGSVEKVLPGNFGNHQYSQDGIYTVNTISIYQINGTWMEYKTFGWNVKVGEVQGAAQDGSEIGQPAYNEGENNPLCEGMKLKQSAGGEKTVDFSGNYKKIGHNVIAYAVNWSDGEVTGGPPPDSVMQSRELAEGSEPYVFFTLDNGRTIVCEDDEIEYSKEFGLSSVLDFTLGSHTNR